MTKKNTIRLYIANKQKYHQLLRTTEKKKFNL
jgi:hypothetical protein